MTLSISGYDAVIAFAAANVAMAAVTLYGFVIADKRCNHMPYMTAMASYDYDAVIANEDMLLIIAMLRYDGLYLSRNAMKRFISLWGFYNAFSNHSAFFDAQ
jgi:hypothetical protein